MCEHRWSYHLSLQDIFLISFLFSSYFLVTLFWLYLCVYWYDLLYFVFMHTFYCIHSERVFVWNLSETLCFSFVGIWVFIGRLEYYNLFSQRLSSQRCDTHFFILPYKSINSRIDRKNKVKFLFTFGFKFLNDSF